MPERVYVLAGNDLEFRNWCADNGRKPGVDAVQIRTWRDLRGRSGDINVEKIGTWALLTESVLSPILGQIAHMRSSASDQ